MDVLYSIGCFLISLFLPHLTQDTLPIGDQVVFQISFIVIGLIGYRTFNT
jgi:hypothetical protein